MTRGEEKKEALSHLPDKLGSGRTKYQHCWFQQVERGRKLAVTQSASLPVKGHQHGFILQKDISCVSYHSEIAEESL